MTRMRWILTIPIVLSVADMPGPIVAQEPTLAVRPTVPTMSRQEPTLAVRGEPRLAARQEPRLAARSTRPRSPSISTSVPGTSYQPFQQDRVARMMESATVVDPMELHLALLDRHFRGDESPFDNLTLPRPEFMAQSDNAAPALPPQDGPFPAAEPSVPTPPAPPQAPDASTIESPVQPLGIIEAAPASPPAAMSNEHPPATEPREHDSKRLHSCTRSVNSPECTSR